MNNILFIFSVISFTYYIYHMYFKNELNFKHKENFEEKNISNPDLSYNENKIKNELLTNSFNNQQYLLNPSNEFTNERLKVDKLLRMYISQ